MKILNTDTHWPMGSVKYAIDKIDRWILDPRSQLKVVVVSSRRNIRIGWVRSRDDIEKELKKAQENVERLNGLLSDL